MKGGGRDALDGRNMPLVESRYLKQPPLFYTVPQKQINSENKYFSLLFFLLLAFYLLENRKGWFSGK